MKSPCKKLASLLIITSLFSFGTNSANAKKPDFTGEQICKAAIGTLMGRDPLSIRVTEKIGTVVHLYYVRNDGTKWAYRCRLEGQKIIWATADGRWRTEASDEKITFRAKSGSLEINQQYSDGSSSKETFKKSQLGN